MEKIITNRSTHINQFYLSSTVLGIILFLFLGFCISLNSVIAQTTENGNLINELSEIPFEDLKQSDCDLQQFIGNNPKSDKFLNDYPEEAIFKNPDNQNSFELMCLPTSYLQGVLHHQHGRKQYAHRFHHLHAGRAQGLHLYLLPMFLNLF